MSSGGIIVDVILFIIILGNAVLCYRKGLVGLVFSVCSSIIAIVLVFLLYKPATTLIIQYTPIDDNLKSAIEEKLADVFETGTEQVTQEVAPKDEKTNRLMEIFVGDQISSIINNTKGNMVEYVSMEITEKIVGILAFLILFVVIKLVLFVAKVYIEAIADLPIIKTLNHSGGMVYGVVRGFFICYVIFAIISLLMPVIDGTAVSTAIENSFIGARMFNNNILLNLIFKFL